LDAWMTTLEPSATDDFALGSGKFAEMLHATERVDIPLAQLKQIAQRDLERNLSALREACRVYAAGQSVEACVAKMNANKPKGSPILAARQQLIRLKSFVEEHQLVSIPSSELADVEETPEYDRWNAAQIRIPGPYEHGLRAKYQIAPPDPSWT